MLSHNTFLFLVWQSCAPRSGRGLHWVYVTTTPKSTKKTAKQAKAAKPETLERKHLKLALVSGHVRMPIDRRASGFSKYLYKLYKVLGFCFTMPVCMLPVASSNPRYSILQTGVICSTSRTGFVEDRQAHGTRTRHPEKNSKSGGHWGSYRAGRERRNSQIPTSTQALLSTSTRLYGFSV